MKFNMLCNRCGTLNVIDIDFAYESIIENCNDNNGTFIRHQIITCCKGCPNESVDISIEPGIAKAVEIFNQKGYITIMCCEGHDSLNGAFVYFDKMYQQIPEIEEIKNGCSVKYVLRCKCTLEEQRSKIKKIAEIVPENKDGIQKQFVKFTEWLNKNPEYRDMVNEAAFSSRMCRMYTTNLCRSSLKIKSFL